MKRFFKKWMVCALVVAPSFAPSAYALFDNSKTMFICDAGRTGDIKEFKTVIVDSYDGRLARDGDRVGEILDDVDNVCGLWGKKYMITHNKNIGGAVVAGGTYLGMGAAGSAALGAEFAAGQIAALVGHSATTTQGAITAGMTAALAKMGLAIPTGLATAVTIGLPIVIGAGVGYGLYSLAQPTNQVFREFYYATGGQAVECRDGFNDGRNLTTGMSCGPENMVSSHFAFEQLNAD